MEVVPGTSQPDSKSQVLYFRPTPGKVKYLKKFFRKSDSAYALDYWRTVSRKQSYAPYQVGSLNLEDTDRLQCEMVHAHGAAYVQATSGK